MKRRHLLIRKHYYKLLKAIKDREKAQLEEPKYSDQVPQEIGHKSWEILGALSVPEVEFYTSEADEQTPTEPE